MLFLAFFHKEYFCQDAFPFGILSSSHWFVTGVDDGKEKFNMLFRTCVLSIAGCHIFVLI